MRIVEQRRHIAEELGLQASEHRTTVPALTMNTSNARRAPGSCSPKAVGQEGSSRRAARPQPGRTPSDRDAVRRKSPRRACWTPSESRLGAWSDRGPGERLGTRGPTSCCAPVSETPASCVHWRVLTRVDPRDCRIAPSKQASGCPRPRQLAPRLDPCCDHAARLRRSSVEAATRLRATHVDQ
jgi:hypothetical protein